MVDFTPRRAPVLFTVSVVIFAVPPEKLRRWMIVAYNENMVSGDYVFIYVSTETPSNDVMTNWFSDTMWRESGSSSNYKAKKAFKNVLVVSTNASNTKVKASTAYEYHVLVPSTSTNYYIHRRQL